MSTPRTSQEQDDRLDMLAERYRSVEVEYRPLTERVVARCFTASPDLDPVAALLRTVIIEPDGTEREGCRWCGRRPAEGSGLCVVCVERKLDFAEDAREQTEPLFDEDGQARYVLLPLLAAVVIAVATLAAVCAATAQARHHRACHRHRCSPALRHLRERARSAPDDEPAAAPALSRPTLTDEERAWIDAQGVPPELRRYVEDAIGYWHAIPDAPVSFRLAACDQPGAEHAGGCEYADYGSGACGSCSGPPARYVIDLYPGCYPTPTSFIPDPSLVGFAVLVTHEVGHALGHTHAEGGIMDGDNPYQVDQAYPYEQT